MSQLFESNATATISCVVSTFQRRGNEYGDTWKDCQWLALKAAFGALGLKAPSTELCRKLAAAALVDVKYQRLQGGYKRDTVIDGIAYAANWAEEMFDSDHPV